MGLGIDGGEPQYMHGSLRVNEAGNILFWVYAQKDKTIEEVEIACEFDSENNSTFTASTSQKFDIVSQNKK